jgi:hypothetical protein
MLNSFLREMLGTEAGSVLGETNDKIFNLPARRRRGPAAPVLPAVDHGEGDTKPCGHLFLRDQETAAQLFDWSSLIHHDGYVTSYIKSGCSGQGSEGMPSGLSNEDGRPEVGVGGASKGGKARGGIRADGE